MGAEILLNKLTKVRKTSGHSWIACCPAHGDNSPSLGVKEVEDGRILLHCFAGCGAGEILDAIGMAFSDLYPESLGQNVKPIKRPWISQDVLRCLALEAFIVLQCANAIKNGSQLSEVDFLRLTTAIARFQAGERMCHA